MTDLNDLQYRIKSTNFLICLIVRYRDYEIVEHAIAVKMIDLKTIKIKLFFRIRKYLKGFNSINIYRVRCINNFKNVFIMYRFNDIYKVS